MTGLLTLLGLAAALVLLLLTGMLVRHMRRPPRHTAGYALARGLAVDPGEHGLKFEDWVLERADGALLAVWEIRGQRSPPIAPNGSTIAGRRDRQGAALTAVLIHGWGHGRVDSLARVKPLLDLFDRIVIYDLRGHGDSIGSLSRLGQGEDADLLALLERLGDGHFVLIGHSMGAVIAIA